jgi:hypothetical protein
LPTSERQPSNAAGLEPSGRGIDPRESRELGFVAYSVPNGFFDLLPESELAAWEGDD